MSEADSNGLGGTVPTWLVLVALGVGAGGNIVGLSQDTSDRYHAEQAARDLAARDRRIERLEDDLHSHLEHSAKYSNIIDELKEEHDNLEQLMVKHVRGHMEGRR